MSNHTPGPWEYGRTSSDDDRFDIYQAQTGWTIARTVNNSHVDCRPANAKLIAAAPDLLSACETALKVVSEIADIESGCQAGWAHKQLWEAIQKAKA